MALYNVHIKAGKETVKVAKINEDSLVKFIFSCWEFPTERDTAKAIIAQDDLREGKTVRIDFKHNRKTKLTHALIKPLYTRPE